MNKKSQEIAFQNAVDKLKQPSKRTLYRAKKNPAGVSALALCTRAVQEKTTAEQILKMPLYFAGRRVDGILEHFGEIYAYQKELPAIPPPGALFVAKGTKPDDTVVLTRLRKGATRIPENFIGIVTMQIRLLPIEGMEDVHSTWVADETIDK